MLGGSCPSTSFRHVPYLGQAAHGWLAHPRRVPLLLYLQGAQHGRVPACAPIQCRKIVEGVSIYFLDPEIRANAVLLAAGGEEDRREAAGARGAAGHCRAVGRAHRGPGEGRRARRPGGAKKILGNHSPPGPGLHACKRTCDPSAACMQQHVHLHTAGGCLPNICMHGRAAAGAAVWLLHCRLTRRMQSSGLAGRAPAAFSFIEKNPEKPSKNPWAAAGRRSARSASCAVQKWRRRRRRTWWSTRPRLRRAPPRPGSSRGARRRPSQTGGPFFRVSSR